MFKGTHLNKHKFINQLLTTSNNFYFFTKSRNILSKSTNISKINNNHSITSYQNHTLTNISNSLHKKKKSFSIKKIHNVKLKMKKPSSHTKQPNTLLFVYIKKAKRELVSYQKKVLLLVNTIQITKQKI